LSQIAEAWKSDELLELMVTKDIGTSSLLSHGMYPRQPSPETIGIYRLMSEVTHILNGCGICPCNSFSCKFHSREEPSFRLAIHSMVVSEGTGLGPIGGIKYIRQMHDERNREQN
jgi:hypothetical protein